MIALCCSYDPRVQGLFSGMHTYGAKYPKVQADLLLIPSPSSDEPFAEVSGTLG